VDITFKEKQIKKEQGKKIVNIKKIDNSSKMFSTSWFVLTGIQR
jgi:hypothetical protein